MLAHYSHSTLSPINISQVYTVNGNLWDYYARGYYVVVPTNIGWQNSRSMIENHMGAGTAKTAALRWPELPLWYARQCQAYGHSTPLLRRDELRLVFLPVKPLAQDPACSWNQPASTELIRHGLRQLAAWWSDTLPRVATPLLGIHDGELEPQFSLCILREELDQTDIVVVDSQV